VKFIVSALTEGGGLIMLRKKIAIKVLVILGFTLGIGLTLLVGSSIYLQTNASKQLELHNTRNLAAVVIKGNEIHQGSQTEEICQ